METTVTSAKVNSNSGLVAAFGLTDGGQALLTLKRPHETSKKFTYRVLRFVELHTYLVASHFTF